MCGKKLILFCSSHPPASIINYKTLIFNNNLLSIHNQAKDKQLIIIKPKVQRQFMGNDSISCLKQALSDLKQRAVMLEMRKKPFS